MIQTLQEELTANTLSAVVVVGGLEGESCWVAWEEVPSFWKPIFSRQKKRRLLEVLTVAMLEVVFWPVLCNGMLRIFPKNNCSKMSVKISHLFF